METSFSLVARFQYRENYAFDADGYPDAVNPYWKNKGSYEMIVEEGMSIDKVAGLGRSDLESLVQDAIENRDEVQPNSLVEYDLIDWMLEEQSEASLQIVLDKLVEDDNNGQDLEYGYFVYRSYELDMSEAQVHYMLDVLYERGLIWLNRKEVQSFALIALHPERNMIAKEAA